jgi:molybdopterin-guanine dinucleotide biosynthesis protein A
VDERLTPAGYRREAIGVVLAGGLSRRMGHLGPKAALPIGGEPLLARVARRLHAADLSTVVAIGPAYLAMLVPGVPVIADRRAGTPGPLAGLETALAWAAAMPTCRGVPASASDCWVFAVACDMPFVAPALVRAMVQRAVELPDSDALVLRSARGTEQLHAAYRVACLDTVSALLDAGARSLLDLLAHVRTAEFPAVEAARYDPSGWSAFNANSPEDWQRALTLAATEE